MHRHGYQTLQTVQARTFLLTSELVAKCSQSALKLTGPRSGKLVVTTSRRSRKQAIWSARDPVTAKGM